MGWPILKPRIPAGTAQNPGRYTIAVVYGTGTGTGITHYQTGSNGDPHSKIDGFDALIRGGPTRDVAFMKLCVGDFPPWTSDSPDDVWHAYRDTMADLQQDYPDTVFVWWTAPLTTQSDNQGNAEKAIYNALVRDYVTQNGGFLFDVADIQSHDPSGNPVTGPTGYEAMYDAYSSDGAHLNETGRQRVARALWWLLARTAGWPGASDWISITPVTNEMSVHPGETATYALSVTASAGFTDPVTLTLQGAPSETTTAFDVNPVTPPGTSHLHITTAASTSAGIHAMTVTGASDALSDTADLTLIVASAAPPSFTLSVSPTIRTAEPNQMVSYTTFVTGAGGFSHPVTLTIVGLPTGIDADWSTNPITPATYSTLTLSIPSSPPFGRHSMHVIGVADTQVVTQGIELVITYPFRVYLPTILR